MLGRCPRLGCTPLQLREVMACCSFAEEETQGAPQWVMPMVSPDTEMGGGSGMPPLASCPLEGTSMELSLLETGSIFQEELLEEEEW